MPESRRQSLPLCKPESSRQLSFGSNSSALEDRRLRIPQGIPKSAVRKDFDRRTFADPDTLDIKLDALSIEHLTTIVDDPLNPFMSFVSSSRSES